MEEADYNREYSKSICCGVFGESIIVQDTTSLNKDNAKCNLTKNRHRNDDGFLNIESIILFLLEGSRLHHLRFFP